MKYQEQQAESTPAEQNLSPFYRKRSPVSYDRGVQIAAARLRLVCDRRLGKETPGWIRQLAAQKLAGEY